MNGIDPLGLINLVVEWNAAGYMGLGGEGAIGLYLTASTTFPYIDAGVLGTAGGGGGQLIGTGIEAGLVAGNECTLKGVTYNIEGALPPVGATAMFAVSSPVKRTV